VNQSRGVFVAVLLGDEDIVVPAIPAARPVFVCPADAEWEIGLTAREHRRERTFEQAPAREPVAVVAERRYAVLACEGGLARTRGRVAQIVTTELARRVRLIVVGEARLRSHDVAPLGEAFTPPAVVFRDRMVLRQVERDQPDVGRSWRHRCGAQVRRRYA